MPPFVVVSPHLDDAVLSCGRLLAGNPDVLVVTVFAGNPGMQAAPTPWDAECGFGPGDDVVAARRAEDTAALSILDARPVWLDLLDEQYREVRWRRLPGRSAIARRRGPGRALVAEVAAAIARALPPHVPVVGPLGLIHHDHRAVAEAMAMVRRDDPVRQWWVYADIPYEGRAGDEVERQTAGFEPGLPGPLGDAGRRRQALAAYSSQLRGLEPEWPLIERPERFWRVGTMAP